MPHVTMSDIARRAGVSQQAVSQILNNKTTMISPATREKVMRLVKELNYHPNSIARSLRHGKRYCIGVAGTGSLSSMDDLSAARIYSGIGSVAGSKGYNLLFFPLAPANTYEILIQAAKSKMVDGIIVFVYSSWYQGFVDRTAPLLLRENVPFVAIHATSLGFPCPNVGIDTPRAGYLAARHLADQGYRHIGLITSGNKAYGTQLFNGCQEALQEKGLIACDLRDEAYDYSAAQGYKHGRQIIGQHPELDGFVVHSDAYANGLVRALIENGRRVPQDAGVVGCENLFKENLALSTLTAVDRRHEERGTKAAEILFDIMDNGTGERQVVLEPELIIRESTKR
jgi:LacI family transcriptional regulator